jgi:hypothetical protein
MRTLPIFGGQEVQTGMMLVAPNADGFVARAYKMPPSGVTSVHDLEPLGAAGQYDHDRRLVRELPDDDPRPLLAGKPPIAEPPFWAGLA